LESKYPDPFAIEYMIGDMFERLKVVRDINKKHI